MNRGPAPPELADIAAALGLGRPPGPEAADQDEDTRERRILAWEIGLLGHIWSHRCVPPRCRLAACRRNRVCRLVTPFREHHNQHFGVTYSRIGLPEPYATDA